MSVTPSLQVKRVFDPAQNSDGVRVLVDRLWPRGVAKAGAKIDHWMKDLAPSNDLRRRFHDGAVTFAAFATAYRAELRKSPAKEEFARLRDLAVRGAVTLLFAVRDEDQNNAVVLRDLLSAS